MNDALREKLLAASKAGKVAIGDALRVVEDHFADDWQENVGWVGLGILIGYGIRWLVA